MSKPVLLTAVLLAALLFECTSPVAGGSSQQGNGYMVGSVVSTEGTPSADVQIRLRPVSYVAQPGLAHNNDDAFNVVTDATGSFTVSGISPGSYMIEANDNAGSAVLVSATLEEDGDTADVGVCSLQPYARIFGVAEAAITGQDDDLYVQIEGLERLVQVDNDGSFSIADLPEGDFDLRFVVTDTSVKPVAQLAVSVMSGDDASVVIPAGWRYACSIRLNTTPTGADVAGTVTDFPVLVRLTEDNFNFGEAKTDGSDIRFTKSAAVFMPCAIERWDPVAGLAEVWVKVDTVFGNDSTQGMTMCWGNEDADPFADAFEVFDTADGFAGVWHLNDDGENITDATAAARNGENSGTVPVAGIIGNAAYFSDSDYIRISGLCTAPQNVTLSAWARYDTATEGQDIISIGDAVLIRVDDSIFDNGSSGSFHNDSIVTDTNYAYASSGRYLAKTGWHYLTYTIDTATHTQTLYIDGVESAASNDVNPIHYDGLGTDTYLGIHGNGKTNFNYIGLLDEVRIHTAAVSADWVKLCYMNQMADDKLVVW